MNVTKEGIGGGGAQELLAMVAHDLRNPLSCIQGYAEMLIAKELPQAERDQLLARILSCGRFAEQITEDLMDAGAIASGQLTARPARVLLQGILRQALETMEHSAASREVRLSLHAPEVDYSVQADSRRIAQVVQNLVSNAIRHVEPGVGRIDVTLHDLDGVLVVEVTDNGCGIASEDFPRIFEKFFRGDDDRTRGSLGLGLFIANRIIELHGGRLWARSDGPGKGASFFFSLPKYDPEAVFRQYKASRGCATPPPRQSSLLDRARQPSGRPRLGLRFSIAALLVVAHLALLRCLSVPIEEEGAVLASSAPAR